MIVGLGTGSTAVWAIRRIGERLAQGALQNVLGVPTSTVSANVARELGIPLVSLADHPVVDLTIDGADEVDPALNLIKGAGGALLHEKIVAQASLREVIVVDEGKPSAVLGTHFALPVEVLQFGWKAAADFVETLGGESTLRTAEDGSTFVTDEGNWIIDCTFAPIDDPPRLSALLAGRAAVVEHGLFLGLATDLLIASATGVEHRTRA